ncbi:hypothetical protein PVV74_13235 [Roseovarius sp. SK2]|uniref:hypothetical protein n=1 Tax=Roseovarius TaxID=74030 RepID=UPI00237ACB70|nr:hypothetical protein [Roseovarius sp. SK2]MDD9726426.1 hypothetical protein [Roseovarius sp. SK2]
MRHAFLFEPRVHRARSRHRRALLLALGLAILSGLAVSGTAYATSPERQGFSKPGQSPSFMPETVRLRIEE